MSSEKTVTEEQIKETIKRWCGAWLNPSPPVRCDICKSTYEEGYCSKIHNLTVCKGCQEQPL